MKALKWVGYGAFFGVWFIFGLYITFPWSVVKDWIFATVRAKSGVEIKSATFSPNWVTGVKLTKVQIQPPGSDASIALDQVTARVGLFSLLTGDLAVSAQIEAGQGTIDAAIKSGSEKVSVDAEVRDVQVDKVVGLAELSGVPMEGTLKVDAKLTLHKKNPKETVGDVTIKFGQFKLKKGGKLTIMPMDELEIGDVELALPLREGKINFDKTKLDGVDLAVSLNGQFSPAIPFGRSNVNLIVGIKPKDKLEKKFGPMLMGFHQFKNPEGYFGMSLNGMVAGIRMPKGVRPP